MCGPDRQLTVRSFKTAGWVRNTFYLVLKMPKRPMNGTILGSRSYLGKELWGKWVGLGTSCFRRFLSKTQVVTNLRLWRLASGSWIQSQAYRAKLNLSGEVKSPGDVYQLGKGSGGFEAKDSGPKRHVYSVRGHYEQRSATVEHRSQEEDKMKLNGCIVILGQAGVA